MIPNRSETCRLETWPPGASAPIGVFDSGVGGLSIFRGVSAELPNEHLIYLADSAFAPYGDKPDTEIRARSEQVVAWLVARGVKAVVIACNTATAAAVQALRARYDLPIIGVEPGVKPAVLSSVNRCVGVLATQYTVESEKFQRLIAAHHTQAEIHVQGCPGLVETLEWPGNHRTRLDELLRRYLSPLVESRIDRLVLGCTHYSFLMDEMRALLPDQVQILDTPIPVARELRRRLSVLNLLNPASEPGHYQFYTTAPAAEHSASQFRRLLGYAVEVAQTSLSER